MQRSAGALCLTVVAAPAGGATARLAEAFQSGSARLRFPRAPDLEAMVLNTSGGLAGGDSFSLSARAEGGALTVSTQACERVYRSEGDAARVEQSYAVAAGAALRVLPQPTILFDGAALRRRTRIEAAAGGTLVLVEGLVLGRAAMGENVASLAVSDRIELVVDGRLAFVDALRLDACALRWRDDPAGLGGARGIGLVVALGVPDAVDKLRAALAGMHAGASLVGGVAVARVLAPSHTALQDALARAVQALSGPPPRAWAL